MDDLPNAQKEFKEYSRLLLKCCYDDSHNPSRITSVFPLDDVLTEKDIEYFNKMQEYWVKNSGYFLEYILVYENGDITYISGDIDAIVYSKHGKPKSTKRYLNVDDIHYELYHLEDSWYKMDSSHL